MPNPADHAALVQRLQAVHQAHALRWYHELSADSQRALLGQLNSIDLDALPALVETYVKKSPTLDLSGSIEPARYYPYDPASKVRAWDRRAAHAAGEQLLKAGKIAAFVVAGGQGSRLGYEGPKGCYPATPITRKPLFQLFAESLAAAQRRYGRPVPWYIMTSPLNHAATVAFFNEHSYFGLDRANVMFFPQGVMPSFDINTGQLLMSSKSEIATNPDGHGGSIKALHSSGALADMRRRGIEHLSYFQVDNPSVRVLDPVFIGLHATAPDSSAEMSSKMVPKAYPDEKLGVFCNVRGKLDVIEYSDMPKELANARDAAGQLRFLCGSIAIHIVGVNFIEKLATDPAFALPYHRAEKKIPCINITTGEPINPTTNNGVKLERFVFDALARCKSSIVYETDRVEEFAPIKNATGIDSIESSRELQTLRAARWLEAAGAKVPTIVEGKPDCILEISPLTATSPEELQAQQLPKEIARGSKLVM